MNWRIITCEGLWGIPKYEVEFWNKHFWESRFDGEGNLKQCFSYLYKMNVISMDEKRFQINKWCNKTAILS
jgi:hypothetical protein